MKFYYQIVEIDDIYQFEMYQSMIKLTYDKFVVNVLV